MYAITAAVSHPNPRDHGGYDCPCTKLSKVVERFSAIALSINLTSVIENHCI